MAGSIDAGSVSVKITADASGVKRALKDTSRNLNKVQRQVNQNERTWQSWSVRSVAATVALGMAVSAVTRKTIEYADSFQSLTNKLKIATDGTEELTQVTSAMFSMANENRASIDTTVDLFTKLERSTRELGFSQEKLINVTDVIGKAFVVGGATAKEMDGAIRQMGQSLSLGALRGEEFNSVAEQAPVIMEAMKSATGKNAGELRKLAATGAITSKILIQSIEAYSEKIRSDFSETQATYGGKMEIARNKAIEFVGANEQIKEVVNDAGDAIVYLSENIDGLITVVEAAATMYGVHLVAAVVKASKTKLAAIGVSAAEKAALISEMEARLANIKVTEAETVVKIANNNAKIRSGLAAVQAAEGTTAEAAASAKLNASIARQTTLQNTLTNAKRSGAIASMQLAAATNVATGAMARFLAVSGSLFAAMGGWVTIAGVAAYGLYKIASAESEAEIKARTFNSALEARLGLISKLAAQDLAIQVKVASDNEAIYVAQLNKTTAAIEEQRKANIKAALNGEEVQTKKIENLRKERDEIRKNLNRIQRIQQGLSDRQLELMKGDSEQKQILIDMDYNASVDAAKKLMALAKKRSRDEMQVITDARDAQLSATSLIAEDAINKITEATKYEGDKAVDILAIQTQLKADLAELESTSSAQILEIKQKAKEEQDALDAQTPQAKAQERLAAIIQESKSKSEIEQERWAEEKAFLEEQWGVKGEMDAVNKSIFEEREAQHQARMKEIRGDDNYIAELQERFASKAELEDVRYESEIERLMQYYNDKKLTDQEYIDWADTLWVEHQVKKTKIEVDEAKKRDDAAKREMMSKINYAQNMANGVLAIGEIFGGKSKKQQKRMRRAQVVVDTAAGVMKAFGTASDIYSAIALSAMVVARGKKSLDAINSESAPSGGSTSIPTAPTPTAPTADTGGQASPRSISIDMTGSSMFSTDQVRELMGQINNQIGDGVELITTGG